jgi:hypothetical protein
MRDNDAIDECKLAQLVESLPSGYVVIDDAAYIPTKHMAAIFFCCDKSKPDNDNFNYYCLQRQWPKREKKWERKSTGKR